jgi:hypothetical protein
MKTNLALFLFAATTLGCVHALPAYVPVEGPAAAPRAGYLISVKGAGAPVGAIAVNVIGSEAIPVGMGAPPIYLHLRITAMNSTDDVRWALDPNEQRLACGDRSIAPAFAKASRKSPVLYLRKGAMGTLDLYYPLPDQPAPQVTLEWRVRRGSELLAVAATAFERVQPERSFLASPEHALRPYNVQDDYDPLSDRYDPRLPYSAGAALVPPASNAYGDTASYDTQAPTASSPSGAPPPVESAPVQVDGAGDKSGWRGGGNP